MAPEDEKDTPLISIDDISAPDDPSIETFPDGTVIVRDDT